MALSPGTRLGHYDVTALLGEGGMGQVYQAHDSRLQRTVAIKVLAKRDEEAAARLLQEARAASALDHPNICTVYEVGEHEGQSFIAMAYVEGKPLSQLIPSDGLPPESVIRYGTQIADALAHAHERGIVHRDLKSQNVVITPEGRAKVLDFGLAARMPQADAEVVTKTQEVIPHAGMLVGTLAYMAPEVLRGEQATARSDIWAVGVLLYEMASGKPPFTGTTQTDVVSAIVKDSLAPLASKVSAGLRNIVQRCLVKEPGQRYRHASAVQAALEAISSSTSGATEIAADLQPPAVPSVAVLPFTDMSPQRDQEYFCEGIAEEIINALSGDALRVAARTSSFQAKAKGLDIADVGARLKVDTVLQGSLRKAGDQLRITAQLVKVADGYQMWSERFDRPMNDVFTVQDEIARAIATRLNVSLIPQAGGTMLAPPTSNLDAYNAFLKGRFLMAKGKHPEAADQFEQALQLDPQYAAAHADLAEATAYMGDLGFVEPKAAAVRARKAAERALELDPRLTQAVVTLAWIAMGSDWDWASAERHFTRALALDPRLGDAHARYGFFLSVCGRFDDAVAQVERAVELDPMNYMMHHWRGVVPCLGGRPDDAISRLRQALDLEADNWLARMFLGMALRLASRPQEALDAGRRAVKDGGRHPWAVAELGITHTAAGETAQAVALQDELTARSHSEHGAPIHHAALCVALGKLDRAFELLDRAYDTRDVWCIFLSTMPDFDAVRSDPSFQAVLRRMSFPAHVDAP